MDKGLCFECKQEEIDLDKVIVCEQCSEQYEQEQHLVDEEQRYRDGLADYADSLGDSVRCGDMTMGQAQGAFARASKRRY